MIRFRVYDYIVWPDSVQQALIIADRNVVKRVRHLYFLLVRCVILYSYLGCQPHQEGTYPSKIRQAYLAFLDRPSSLGL